MHEQAWIVAYDIRDNRRRTRVARYLVARAARVQKSVFVGRWTPAAARKVRQALERMLDASGDQIMMEPVAGQRFETPRALIL